MNSNPSTLLRRRRAGTSQAESKATSSDVVRAEPLYDQIYEILWQKILRLEIVPGTPLRDLEWAKKLNVSRTPVREALRKMQKDGVLQGLNNGRYILKRIGSNELRALYRCRAALEALAIRDLSRVPPKEIAKLHALVDETVGYLEKRDTRSVFQLHTEFHERLTSLTDNSYLLGLLENLRRLILYARASLRTVSDEGSELGEMYVRQMERSQAHHASIMISIAAQDFDGAANQMEAHLFETAEDMCAILDRATAVAGHAL